MTSCIRKYSLLILMIYFSYSHAAWAAPKNIIFLIGDGMGFEQVRAAGMYAHGQAGTLVYESFPYQAQVTTHSADSSMTDSAAGSTALATGTKVNNGVISMSIPGHNSELYTLLERFRDHGKRTGLVTTTYISHATPAAFGAHESSRSNYAAIVSDYLTQTQPNVLFGGAKYMSIAAAESAGYTVVTNKSDLQSLNTGTVTLLSGQFGNDNLPYMYDGTGYATLPDLSEMTAAALDILDNDPDGFFIMVEGGKIDHAGHENNIARNIFEIIELDDTVVTILTWAQGRSDTLILLTADHETGGLTALNNNGQGVLPDISWSTTGHTAANVPVYAIGENAHLISGTMDNTDFFDLATFSSTVPVVYYCDEDMDGYIASAISGNCIGTGCEPVDCEVTVGNDCDDSTPSVYPTCDNSDTNPAIANDPPTEPQLLYPEDQQLIVETTVEFKWQKSTDPDGNAVTYDLYVCEDDTMIDCIKRENIAYPGNGGMYFAGMGSGLFIFGIAFAGGISNNRKIHLLLSMTIIVMLSVSCGSSGGGDINTPQNINEVVQVESGLKAGWEYHWKVIADDGHGGIVESNIRSFTTQ